MVDCDVTSATLDLPPPQNRMLNENDSKAVSKAMSRVEKYLWALMLLTSPLGNVEFFQWFAPRAETLFKFLQSNYPTLYPYAVGFALIGMGWIAFQVKTRWRLIYGAAELFIAYFSGVAWFTSAEQFGVKELIAGAAVVYLVVRGLDNMREAKKAKASATAIALPPPSVIRSD